MLACGDEEGRDFEVTGELGAPIQHEFVQNIPIAEVSVNGSTPRWFVLDTGAQIVLLDEPFAEEIGFPESILPRALDTIAIGALEIKNAGTVTYDLAPLTAQLGVEIDGFLGASLFEHFTSLSLRSGQEARPNLFAFRSLAFAASTSRSRGGELVSMFMISARVIFSISSTAFSNNFSFFADGFVVPLTLRTY
jgi:hypothetical protein